MKNINVYMLMKFGFLLFIGEKLLEYIWACMFLFYKKAYLIKYFSLLENFDNITIHQRI